MKRRGLTLLCIGLLGLSSRPAAGRQLSNAEKRRRILELYHGYQKELGRFPEITVKELLATMKRGQETLLVDAREKREQRVSMIRGAVPAGAFLERLERGREPRGMVVVYCTIGYRSAVLVKKLARRKVQARNLSGGILMWTHHGRPLHRKGKLTQKLHVYGATWDLAPDGIQTTY
jgi:sodium/bile acid cotransporter 7